MATCAAIKANGTRCQAQAMTGDDKCYTHSPATAEARKRTNRRGGKTGGRGRPKLKVDEVYKLADKQIGLLEAEAIDTRVSAIMAQWAQIKLRAIETERKVIDQAELEQKVADIERLYKQRREVGNDSDYPFGGGVWVG